MDWSNRRTRHCFVGLRDGMGANHRDLPKVFCDLFGLMSVDILICPSKSSRAAEQDLRPPTEFKKRLAGEDVHAGIDAGLKGNLFMPRVSDASVRLKVHLLDFPQFPLCRPALRARQVPDQALKLIQRQMEAFCDVVLGGSLAP